MLALGIAIGLERAAAICIDAQRQQDVLTGDPVEAIDAAMKISAYARAWREASEEEATVCMPAAPASRSTDRRRGALGQPRSDSARVELGSYVRRGLRGAEQRKMPRLQQRGMVSAPA